MLHDGTPLLPKRGLRTRRSLENAATIGANIREARRAVGLHHADMAPAIGVSKETLMGYERGTRTAPLALAPTIADVLGMSWTHMFGGCDAPAATSRVDALLAAPELMDILRRVDALTPDARAQLRAMLRAGVRITTPCRS